MNILVAGWFSFEGMGNTAGDMIACDVLTKWLDEADINYDIAVADTFNKKGTVTLESADPLNYTDLIFVCGPFGNGWPITLMLEKFSHCRLTGVNLTLLESLEKWNPFSLLIERDSTTGANPDLTFYAPPSEVPVVGVIMISKQDEYGKRDLHKKAHETIEALIACKEMSVVRIDTALENNKGGLRTPGEVEALITKMDLVITTRLHGTVLSLKNGIPVIPIDPVLDGAKVSKQVREIGWPLLFHAEDVTVSQLSDAFEYCQTQKAKTRAHECSYAARQKIEDLKNQFIHNLSALSTAPSFKADFLTP